MRNTRLWFQRCPDALGHSAAKKAKAEAPVLRHPRQPDEQIGTLLILVVQLGAVKIASLADTNGAAGERNSHPAQRNRFPAHLSA